MPILTYLTDTNAVSDYFRGEQTVREWFAGHKGEIGLSTITMAEIRRGIELKAEGKARRELEKHFRFALEDYRGAIFVFDEAAAVEWGRLMAQMRNHPLPYDDSLIAAIARSADLQVITRNAKHFPACPTVDPWTGQETAAWIPA